MNDGTLRVLIPFGTPYLYGLERGVIEIFDCLRPDVEPHFLQSRWVYDQGLPVINELRRRGLTFSLLPDARGWPRVERPQSVTHAGRMLAAVVKANFSSARALGKRDVLYVTSAYAAIFNLLPALLCRLTGRRVVHHFHDLGGGGRRLRLWTWLVTDFVHNTGFGYRALAAEYPGVTRKHNVVLPYVIDVECSGAPERPQSELEQNLNLFFVGQVSRHKGIDLLLAAFRVVAPRHPSAHLHIVGACHPDFEAEFEQLMADPRLEGRVTHWGYREDARELLRSAYLCVHTSPPSRFAESFGRTVVEAMAFGVPTVCFASGALQEIVVDGQTGTICEESAEALAAAIERFLCDAAFRNRCGESARQRYEERYGRQAVRRMWLKFFEGARDSR